jgi:hypothetical protein
MRKFSHSEGVIKGLTTLDSPAKWALRFLVVLLLLQLVAPAPERGRESAAAAAAATIDATPWEGTPWEWPGWPPPAGPQSSAPMTEHSLAGAPVSFLASGPTLPPPTPLSMLTLHPFDTTPWEGTTWDWPGWQPPPAGPQSSVPMTEHSSLASGLPGQTTRHRSPPTLPPPTPLPILTLHPFPLMPPSKLQCSMLEATVDKQGIYGGRRPDGMALLPRRFLDGMETDGMGNTAGNIGSDYP